jgi:hypothetical protein
MKRESIFAFIRRFGLSEGRVYWDIYEQSQSQHHRKTWPNLAGPIKTPYLLHDSEFLSEVPAFHLRMPARWSVGQQPGGSVDLNLSVNGGGPQVSKLLGFVIVDILPVDGVTVAVRNSATSNQAHVAGGTFFAVELGDPPIVYDGANKTDAVNALRRAAGANGRMSLPNTVQAVPVQWLRDLLFLPAPALTVRGGNPKDVHPPAAL